MLSIGFLSVGFLMSSCSGYLDVNTDPTRINEDQVTLAALLPTVIEATTQAQYSFEFSIGQITQHITSVTGGGADQHEEVRLDGAWSTTYLTAMTNLTLMIDKANALNSPQYAGVGKILLAYNLLTATTTWESVPFSQAFNIKTLKPEYDSQESIYQKINQLLDEAVLDVDKTSVRIVGAEDIMYSGNLARWKAAAKGLKARVAMHRSVKDPIGAATNALAALSGSISSSANDLQLAYNTRNLNPWNSGVALANNTGNFTVRHSQQLVDAMNGTTFGVFDPRLPFIGGRLKANVNVTTWVGSENGSGASSNVDFSELSWHSKATSPIEMITFAETKFIQAEAEFLKNGGTTTSKGTTAAGYQAYLDGITASLNKIGVADTARARYIAAPQVAVGAANLTLQLVMAEKFKAMFLSPETWNDYRRWDFSKDVFKDLDLPRNQSKALAGKWIERALYPLDEFSRNGEVAGRNLKAANVKMWIFTK